MKPSVGRIVHYVSYGTPGGEYHSECRAAVVAALAEEEDHQIRNGAGEVIATLPGEGDPTAVTLCVLNPEGIFFRPRVCQDERTKLGGTWHWPEMVKE